MKEYTNGNGELPPKFFDVLNQAVDEEWIAVLSAVPLRIYLTLLSHRNHLTGRADVGQRRLYAKANCNGPGFRRAMKELERGGLVIVRPGGPGKRDSYELPMPRRRTSIFGTRRSDSAVNGSRRLSDVNDVAQRRESSPRSAVNGEHNAPLAAHDRTFSSTDKNNPKQLQGELVGLSPSGLEKTISVDLKKSINTLLSWGVHQSAIDGARRDKRDAAWFTALIQYCEDVNDEYRRNNRPFEIDRFAAAFLRGNKELPDPDAPSVRKRKSRSGDIGEDDGLDDLGPVYAAMVRKAPRIAPSYELQTERFIRAERDESV